MMSVWTAITVNTLDLYRHIFDPLWQKDAVGKKLVLYISH